MKQRITILLATLICCFFSATCLADDVTVTLTMDDGVEKTAAVMTAESNLGAVLTEINRAQKAKTDLTTRGLPMDEFSVKSLARIWAVTPFRCDDDEIVERVWVFSKGNMMVSHIPLIITPQGEKFGMGTYQEAVVEFDKNGTITDFRFAIDGQMEESLEHCGSAVDKETQMIILQYVERFRTAYNQKDLGFISKTLSDDALIITGRVVETMQKSDNEMLPAKTVQKIAYTKQNKQQYIANLQRAFIRNKWIDVKFSQIGDDQANGGCAGITRSKVDPTKYGVRLKQEWRSSTYNDSGYLFLLWEFPKDGGDPIIHVRTWQPDIVGGKQQKPDDDISTLAGFDL